MSFHAGRHYYALCDHHEGDRRCETFLIPANCSDVFAPAAVLVARGEAVNAAKEAGWEVTYLGEGEDRVLCPQHRSKRAVAVSTGIVDVPLFDLEGAS